jgi:hypothetical protein
VATGRFPRPHGQRLTHPASHFWVDPAHFLFVYGELRGGDDDELALGRIVGWDPPMSPDELPCPMVRFYGKNAELGGEPDYIGGRRVPSHYWIGSSAEEVRRWVEEWRRRRAGEKRGRAQEGPSQQPYGSGGPRASRPPSPARSGVPEEDPWLQPLKDYSYEPPSYTREYTDDDVPDDDPWLQP